EDEDWDEEEQDGFQFTEDEINILQGMAPLATVSPPAHHSFSIADTELEFKSELVDEQPPQSLDIMSDSYDIMGIRRRSNTAQRLEKLRKERKSQYKTKVVTWKCPTQSVSVKQAGNQMQIRR